MSFLGDIVNSIGSDRSPAPPSKPPARPISANSQRPSAGPRPAVHAAPSPLNGTKRKAEDGPAIPTAKVIRPNPTPGLTSSVSRRPAAPPLHAPKPTLDKGLHLNRPKPESTGATPKPGPVPVASPTSASATTTKAPPKGSFAELAARMKEKQAQGAPQSQIGLIKHQASNREKISKVAERRRQEEDKAKAGKEKPGGRTATGKLEKSRSVSPAKKSDPSKMSKPARGPLHAPPSYKGTMGTASSRTKQQAQRKRRRYDEYLGTDEEEDSEMDDDGRDEEDDYGSDASSDMEAGAFDIDQEEQKALRQAREDDAAELALENQLKREKEERRKRLMSLASKRK